MTDIDQDARLSVIREICRKEGHGELIDCTTNVDHPVRRRHICRRGCGMYILELVESISLAGLEHLLEQRKITGIVRLRGTIEVES